MYGYYVYTILFLPRSQEQFEGFSSGPATCRTGGMHTAGSVRLQQCRYSKVPVGRTARYRTSRALHGYRGAGTQKCASVAQRSTEPGRVRTHIGASVLKSARR